MTPIEYFKFTYGLRDEDLFLIPYGSRVYGTFSEKSDYDYHAIVPANRKANTGTEYRSEELNIHIFNAWDWQQQLNRHKIHTLEGFFHWDGVVAQNFTFKLDLKILRDEISTKATKWHLNLKGWHLNSLLMLLRMPK